MGWQTSEPTRLTGYGTEQSYTNTAETWETVTKVAVARSDANNVCIRVKVTYHYGRAGTSNYSPYQYIYAKLTGVDAYYINRQVSVWGTRTFYYYGPGTAGATVSLTIASSDKSQNYGGHTFSIKYPAYAQTYTIAYNANGGSGAPSSQTKTYGTTLTLSTTIPTRTGYTFLGWSTSSTATTAQYQPGGSYTANASATLYAVWQIITYTITYKANGPSAEDQTQTKNYGTAVTLKGASTFTYTNYTFQYWNTKADGTGTTYAAGASYGTNAALTLYAIWKKNNIPVYINDNETIRQVEKAYMNVGGAIKECTVYLNVDGEIKTIV